MKQRADRLLVEHGLAESGARAQALILAGLVFVGERRIDKAGQALPRDAALCVRGRDHPWVSRGGVKLDHMLTHLGWDVTGAVALDIGSSTGGFSDVLLSRGAARVYAVDSGTNQLAWKLRSDSRVIVHEQTNARLLTAGHIPEPIDLLVCDASFVGLEKVLLVPLRFAGHRSRLVALIKPQFEAERHEIASKGVVRNPAVRDRVCERIRHWLSTCGWLVADLIQSPITGSKGNIEYLIAAHKSQT